LHQSIVNVTHGGRKESSYRLNARTMQCECLAADIELVIGIPSIEAARLLSGEGSDQVHPDDREVVEEALRQMLRNDGSQVTHEFRVRQAGGTYATYAWIRHTAKVVDGEDGATYIEGTVTNVTELKSVQAELRGLRLRYEHLWKQAGAAICQSTYDGRRLLSCNDRMAMLLGYDSAEECIGKVVPAEAYVDPECRPRLMAQLLCCNMMEGVEIEFKRRDGDHVWLRLSFCRHANGEAVDVVAVDITIKKLLTPSEKDVLRHLLAGLNNKEIANHLSRSLRTIENHRAAIMTKLGVNTSIELTKRVMTCELD
jgi:PAS domain S-box-containing protein